MPTTPSLNIISCPGSHWHISKHSTPTLSSRVRYETSTRHFPSCAVRWNFRPQGHQVHLACHGIPDPQQPFESGFALGDGLSRVENIMQYDLPQNARFAYFSACHTIVGDEERPDELIHLAVTMQFAGFRSVIGTMRAVDDGHTNEIKSYQYMVDESGRLDHARAPALALHRTMNSLCLSKILLDQRILYIHIGA